MRYGIYLWNGNAYDEIGNGDRLADLRRTVSARFAGFWKTGRSYTGANGEIIVIARKPSR